MPATRQHWEETERPFDTEEGGRHDFSTFLQGLAGDLKGFVEAQQRLTVMHITEKSSVFMSKLAASMVMYTALGMTLLFLNLALAMFLGDLLDSAPLGFAGVAGIYLVLFGLFRLWWTQGGRDRFIIDRINDMNSNDDEHETP